MTIEQFHTVVQIFCVQFSASVSSAHRTIDHNRVVGGAANSQHMGWKCVDLVLDNWGRKDEAMMWLKNLNLFVLDEVASGGHLHCDDRGNAEL